MPPSGFGYPPAGAPGASPSAYGGAPAARNKKPLAILAGVGGLVLLLLIVGIVALLNHKGDDSPSASGASSGSSATVSGSTDQPQTKPIVDYFNALQNGDIATIKKYATMPSSSSDAALTQAVLDATKNKVHNVKITNPGDSNLSITEVGMAYEIKDQTYSDSYFVNKNGNDWEIDQHDLPTVSVSTSLPNITVNGQKITVSGDGSATSLALPPGDYTFAVPGSKLLDGRVERHDRH